MTLACSNELSSSKSWSKIPYILIFLKSFTCPALNILCEIQVTQTLMRKQTSRVWARPCSLRSCHDHRWLSGINRIPEFYFPHFIPLPTLHSRILDEEKQEVYLVSACYITLPKTQDTVGFLKCSCSPHVSAYNMHWRTELKMSDFRVQFVQRSRYRSAYKKKK